MKCSPIARLLLGTTLLLQPLALAAEARPSFEDGLRKTVTIKGQPAERLRLADRMVRYKVPGIGVAIIEGCKVIEARGFGVAENGGRPIDAHSLFQAASISKPVAALGALRLVEQGKLDLDADINQMLKGWKLPDSPLLRGHPVTLRRLLSHGAGLTVHGFGGYPAGTPVPTLIQVLNGKPPANTEAVRVQAVPGSKWEYSGGGTTVAQLMMIEAAGKPFPALMRELVLAPARMEESGYEQPLPADRVAVAAVAHRGDGTAVPGKWHIYPEMAAAGLWTTPADLARFALEIARAERGEPGALLSRKMARDMLKVQIGTWGLGLEIKGEGQARSFSHGGANEGYRTMLIMYPETCQGAAVMTNSDNGGPLTDEVLRALADFYGWPDPMPSVEREVVAMTPAIAARFAGAYHLKEAPEYKFTIRTEADGGLTFVDPSGGTEKLLASSDRSVFATDSGTQLQAAEGGFKLLPAGIDQSYVAVKN